MSEHTTSNFCSTLHCEASASQGRGLLEKSEEVWVPVQGFPTYAVSNHGNVKNFLTDKCLKQSRHNKGYMKVHLVNDTGDSYVYVHRLVLKHFANNPHGKPHSDHIDGNRSNNHISNLRWASAQENAFNRAPIRNKRGALPKGVSRAKSGNTDRPYKASIKVDGKTQVIGVFPSVEEADEAYRIESEKVHGEYAFSSSRMQTTPIFDIEFIKV